VLASVPAGSGNGANLSDGVLDAVIDQRHIEPKHAVAKPLQCTIAARIRCALALVIAAIHLDDEPSGHCDEVTNEAPQRHLPPEPDAEGATAKGEPEPLLRRRERVAHLTSMLRDDGRGGERTVGWALHDCLLGPARGRATPRPAQDP